MAGLLEDCQLRPSKTIDGFTHDDIDPKTDFLRYVSLAVGKLSRAQSPVFMDWLASRYNPVSEDLLRSQFLTSKTYTLCQFDSSRCEILAQTARTGQKLRWKHEWANVTGKLYAGNKRLAVPGRREVDLGLPLSAGPHLDCSETLDTKTQDTLTRGVPGFLSVEERALIPVPGVWSSVELRTLHAPIWKRASPRLETVVCYVGTRRDQLLGRLQRSIYKMRGAMVNVYIGSVEKARLEIDTVAEA